MPDTQIDTMTEFIKELGELSNKTNDLHRRMIGARNTGKFPAKGDIHLTNLLDAQHSFMCLRKQFHTELGKALAASHLTEAGIEVEP